MYEMMPFTRNHGVDLYRPFRDLEELERSLFANSSAAAFKTDIRDTGDSYVLEAELPGFQKEDITLDLKDGILTITAQHGESTEQKEGGYIRRERRYGSFQRSFDVTGLEDGGITAAYESGILSLTLPKAKPAEPEVRRIAIQ